MKRAAGRRNRYQSKKRYRHFQERISILVLFTTLEKKKKQATDKPYCLLHNNVIRKFSCFFYFSASPKPPPCPVPSPTLLSVGLLSPPFGPSPTTLSSRVSPLRLGGPSTLASLRETDFQSTPTRKKLVGTRRKNRKNLVLGTYY